MSVPQAEEYGPSAARAAIGGSPPRPRSAARAAAVQSLLVVGALVTPPVLMLTVGITLGEGDNLWRALWDLPVVGAVVRALMGAIIWLYSLDLQVGAMTPLWVLNGLYLVFAALFARRRLWAPAAIVLIVPLLVSWYIASLLRD